MYKSVAIWQWILFKYLYIYLYFGIWQKLFPPAKDIFKGCTAGLLRTCFFRSWIPFFVFRRLIFNSNWPILRQQIKRHNIWATRLKCLSLPLSKKTSRCYEWGFTLNMVIAGTVLHIDSRLILYFVGNSRVTKIFKLLCVIKDGVRLDHLLIRMVLFLFGSLYLSKKRTLLCANKIGLMFWLENRINKPIMWLAFLFSSFLHY